MSVVSPRLRDRVRGIATPVALAMGRIGLTPNALMSMLVILLGVVHIAARTPRTLSAAIADPNPAPSITMPASAWPRATARATASAVSG